MKKILESELVSQLKNILFIPAILLIIFFIKEDYYQGRDAIKESRKMNFKIEECLLKMESLEDRIKSQESLTKQFYKWQLDKHASTKNEDYEEDN